MEELQQIHKDCQKIWNEAFFPADGDGRSTACQVWDKLTGKRDWCEDCLGENFNQLIHTFQHEFFNNYTPSSLESIEFLFPTYMDWLNKFVDRVEFIFELINPEDKNHILTAYYRDTFQTMKLIKKWTNFFKHPKHFMFAHSASFALSLAKFDDLNEWIVIDDNFVSQFYSNSKASVLQLENHTKVVVKVPDLREMTKKFGEELNSFFQFICNNEVISDFLRPKSTIKYIEEKDDWTLPGYAKMIPVPVKSKEDLPSEKHNESPVPIVDGIKGNVAVEN